VAFLPVPKLSPGDPVAVVAPAGPFDRQIFERGLAILASRYTPLVSPAVYEKDRYLAGNDAARAADLQQAFSGEAKAVFAARGGYGAMRLLTRITLRPKPLIGFSDITALHAMAQVAGFRSLHAPVITQLGTQSPEIARRLFSALEHPGAPEPLQARQTLTAGVAEGPLLGGNLSTLTRLLGTPFMPSFRGALLLLEDVGERPYRLDRMWTHLALAGVFTDLAGIVLGDFTGCEEKDANYSSADVLQELALQAGVPCASGFAIGHGEVNTPVVLGARARLDATAKTLTFLEGLVE